MSSSTRQYSHNLSLRIVSRGQLVARFFVCVVDANETFSEYEIESDERIRPLLASLKLLPRDLFHVDAIYPQIDPSDVVPFNTRRSVMDIESVVARKQERKEAAKEREVKKLFVAPATPLLPDDGVLKYVTVESVYDVNNVPDRSVMLFSIDALPVLACVSENPGLFDVELVVLSGLPEAEYSAEFDKAVWQLERVAYAPLINDIRVAAESEANLQATQATRHDHEIRKTTKASGDVKDFSNFTIGGSKVDDDSIAATGE